MEKYKYTTKYNIGDNVFAIKHNKPNKFIDTRKVEFYDIYCTKIKSINISVFGIDYRTEDINETFKEENIFLKTDKKGLFNRISEIMENNEGK